MANNLTVTKLYSDSTILTGAQLDAMATSIETFINDTKINDDNIQPVGISKGKLATAVQNALVPTGTILEWAGDTAPSGYLFCDGAGVSTSTYADLFNIISYDYGGSGATFNVPDKRGRIGVGLDYMSADQGAASRLTGVSFDSGDADTLGSNGGEGVHTILAAELATHSHTVGNESASHGHSYNRAQSNHTHAAGGLYAEIFLHEGDGRIYQTALKSVSNRAFAWQATAVVATTTNQFTSATTVAGSTDAMTESYQAVTTGDNDASHNHAVGDGGQSRDTAMNNMQPFLMVNYIIKT